MVRAPLLDVQMSFRVAGARECAPCLKWAKREGFVAVQKMIAGGTFEGNLQRCILRGRRSTRDTWVRHVRRSGRWFPDRGFILEHQIFRFAEVILRDRCSTSYDLSSLFRGKIEWKNRKTHWYEALGFPFLKEVSLYCFIFDVVKFQNWGSLAEFHRFGAGNLQFLSNSGRISWFWNCAQPFFEEVS